MRATLAAARFDPRARRTAVTATGTAAVVCTFVLVCYDDALVARGALWFAPAAAVFALHPRLVARARLSGALVGFGAWLVLVSVVAGLPTGSFMLLLLAGSVATGIALGGLGLATVGRGLLVATGFLVAASVFAVLGPWARAVEADPLNHGAWRGVFNHKNTLGFTAALLVVLTAAHLPVLSRRVAVTLFALGGLALVGSRSMGALGALAYAGLVWALVAVVRRHRRVRFRHVLALTAIVFVAVVAVVPRVIDQLGRDPTLTGRTVMWSALWRDAKQDLVFGHGVGAYWFDPASRPTLHALEQRLHFRPGQAHNGALDTIIDAGLPGLALLALLTGAALRRALAAYRRECAWPLLTLVFACMAATAERGLYGAPMLLVVAAVLSAPPELDGAGR